jgi:hypothetical protein
MPSSPPQKIDLTGGNRKPPGPAWRAAEAEGMDMSLLVENLRMTPWERLVDHQRALNLVLMLQQARIEGHDKPE